MKIIIFFIVFLMLATSIYSKDCLVKFEQKEYDKTPSQISIYTQDWELLYSKSVSNDSFSLTLEERDPVRLRIVLDSNMKIINTIFLDSDKISFIIFHNDIMNIAFINSKNNTDFQRIFRRTKSLKNKNIEQYLSNRKQPHLSKIAKDSLYQIYDLENQRIEMEEKKFYSALPNSYLSLYYTYRECIRKKQSKAEISEFFASLDKVSLSQFDLYSVVERLLTLKQHSVGMSLPSIQLSNKVEELVNLVDVSNDGIVYLYIWDPLCPHSSRLNLKIEEYLTNDSSLINNIISIKMNSSKKSKNEPFWQTLYINEQSLLDFKMSLWSNRVPNGYIINNGKIEKMNCKFHFFLEYMKKKSSK